MSWFSDALFGERKSINTNKINNFMAPYDQKVSEFEDIARQQMDPTSWYNVQRANTLRTESADAYQMNMNNLRQATMMSGGSPAQLAAQTSAAGNTMQGNVGAQIGGLLQANYDTGFGNLQNVANMQKGIGERQANLHIQKVNESNARRDARMGNVMGLLGLGTSMIGSFDTGQQYDIDSKGTRTIRPIEDRLGWGSKFGTGYGALARLFGGGS